MTTQELVAGLQGAKLVTPVALVLEDDLPIERFMEIMAFLSAVHRASPWWIGAAINYAESAYGERYSQIMNDTGLDYQTCVNYAYVERHIPLSRRDPRLSYSTHALVASMSPKDQKKWIKRAVLGEWKRADLREAIKAEAVEAGPDESRDNGGGPGVVEDLRTIARRLWIVAKRNGDHVEIPIEAWEIFVEAGGWENA